jgi:hypothetical protein
MYKLCKHELKSCAEPGEQLNLEMNYLFGIFQAQLLQFFLQGGSGRPR